MVRREGDSLFCEIIWEEEDMGELEREGEEEKEGEIVDGAGEEDGENSGVTFLVGISLSFASGGITEAEIKLINE